MCVDFTCLNTLHPCSLALPTDALSIHHHDFKFTLLLLLLVHRSTLSEEEASDLVRRLASAIAYMHSMEIIHRDLKPGKDHRG